MQRPFARSERGQTLTLFALMLVVLLLAAGLVVDVGYALSQQRTAQNAADFAALAGTRILGESYTGQPAGAGTDVNVVAAVNSVLSANRSQLVSASYVDNAGNWLGNVGGGIPSGAVGVVVNANTSWKPFFLGIIGVGQWSAGVSAAAATQGVSSAGVLPIGINDTAFAGIPYCDPASAPAVYAACLAAPGNLTSGQLNLPGGFGWLKFGAQGKCAGFGLGMDPNSGCESNQGFLQSEVGPPANSHGCCTQLNPAALNNFIGSLTGNKPVDLTYYVKNKVVIWVPIWDTTGGTGANGYYHIVGFGAIVLLGEDTQHGKWLTGVRVSTTYGNTPNATLLGATGAVQLVH
jgi:Putative Flp pilus-assembly TadE/G-like